MRALFVGLGSIGQRHLRNLRSLLGDELEAWACRVQYTAPVLNDELVPQPGLDIAEVYKVRTFPSLEAALDAGPDLVFVTNPTSLHLDTAMAAARTGCHLFIEKPLAHTLDGLDALIREVEQRRLVAMVGYQLRFHPGLQLVREILVSGRLGHLVAARLENGEYLPGWHLYEDYRTSYAARRALGGGALLTQIHEFDYAQWLFGLPRKVFALGGHLSSLEIDVEDVASVLLECTWEGKVLPVHVHLDYLQRPPRRSCQIIGDRGKVYWDYFANEVRLDDYQVSQPKVCTFDGFQRNQIFLDELRHLLACLRGETTPVVSVREGADSLRIALAARQSLESGKVVEL